MRSKDRDRTLGSADGRHDATIREAAPPNREGRHDETMRSEELSDIAAAVRREAVPVEIAPNPAAAGRPKLDMTMRSGGEEEPPPTRALDTYAGGTANMAQPPPQVQALNRALAMGQTISAAHSSSPSGTSSRNSAPAPVPSGSAPLLPLVPERQTPWWLGLVVIIV